MPTRVDRDRPGHPVVRSAINPHIIHCHDCGVWGCAVCVSREITAHRQVHDEKKLMVEDPVTGYVAAVPNGEIWGAGVVSIELSLVGRPDNAIGMKVADGAAIRK